MSQLFKYLRQQYLAQRTRPRGVGLDEHTYVSYPEKWPERLRRMTVDAAKQAGFPQVLGMTEPIAAMQFFLTYETTQTEALLARGVIVPGRPLVVLLIDMGAGTTDLVLFRATPGAARGHQELCTWPQAGADDFGGRQIDDRLSAFITEYLRRNLRDPELAEELVAGSCGEIIAHKEGDVSPLLRANQAVEYCSLIKTFQKRKYLRTEPEAYQIDRAVFEQLLDGRLPTFADLVNGLLDDARANGRISGPDDVDLVLLTGGHSRWYFVTEMLAGRWRASDPGADADRLSIHLPKIVADPERVVESERPQEIVAMGLALTAVGGIDIERRAANNLWYEVTIEQGAPVRILVVKHGQLLPHHETLYHRIGAERGVTAQVINAIVAPVVGVTFEQGYRFAKYSIPCSIPKLTALNDKAGVLALTTRDFALSKVAGGLEWIKERLGDVREGVEGLGDDLKVSDGRFKSSVGGLLGRVGGGLQQFTQLVGSSAGAVKSFSDGIAVDNPDIKQDQIDLILKIEVDRNEQIKYVGAFDLRSAGTWSIFWHNREEPNKDEEHAMWTEIQIRRKSE